VNLDVPPARIPLGDAPGEASIIINRLQATRNKPRAAHTAPLAVRGNGHLAQEDSDEYRG